MKTEAEYDALLKAQSVDAGAVKKKKEADDAGKFGCGLFVFMILIFVAYASFGGGDKPSKARDESSMAYIMAQDFLESHLKSPSTAKYPWGYSDYVTSSQNFYTVRAYVDAQNSFGVALRQPFEAVLIHDGGDKWRCRSLVLDGDVLIRGQ